MYRSDVLTIVFVCVCVCHLCPAHPCGDNPLMFVDNFSRNRGLAPERMLVYLREREPSNYRQLMSDYRNYLECTQMVHTGYFKRSIVENKAESESRLQKTNTDEQYMNEIVQTLGQFFDLKRNTQELSRDYYESNLETNIDNYDTPFETLDQLPVLIKRLIRGKRSVSHNQRSRPKTDV